MVQEIIIIMMMIIIMITLSLCFWFANSCEVVGA